MSLMFHCQRTGAKYTPKMHVEEDCGIMHETSKRYEEEIATLREVIANWSHYYCENRPYILFYFFFFLIHYARWAKGLMSSDAYVRIPMCVYIVRVLSNPDCCEIGRIYNERTHLLYIFLHGEACVWHQAIP